MQPFNFNILALYQVVGLPRKLRRLGSWQLTSVFIRPLHSRNDGLDKPGNVQTFSANNLALEWWLIILINNGKLYHLDTSKSPGLPSASLEYAA